MRRVASASGHGSRPSVPVGRPGVPDKNVLVKVGHPQPGNHRVDVLDLKLGAEAPRQAGGGPPDRRGLGVSQLIERLHMSLRFDKHVPQRAEGAIGGGNQVVLEDEGSDQRAFTTVF